ncbi:hypothetical protein E2C01_059608 [Portunus trituberculatus]|uniref:Uncharacterized protein n=1 Tax=Portunus trituberculatus TaxID=210409 RepID=A0A5B7H5U3_PORTR|nr:hypothetical protein [Portunus trituberculatus]
MRLHVPQPDTAEREEAGRGREERGTCGWEGGSTGEADARATLVTAAGGAAGGRHREHWHVPDGLFPPGAPRCCSGVLRDWHGWEGVWCEGQEEQWWSRSHCSLPAPHGRCIPRLPQDRTRPTHFHGIPPDM